MNQKTLLAIIALLTVLKVGTCADFPNIHINDKAVKFLTDCFASANDLAILRKQVRDFYYNLAKQKHNVKSYKDWQEFASDKLNDLLDKETEAFTSASIDQIALLVADNELVINVGNDFADAFKGKIKFLDGSHDFYFELFQIFGILAQKDQAQKKFAKDIANRYRMTPYHNICHGVYVGLASASAYLAQSKYYLNAEGAFQDDTFQNAISNDEWFALKGLFFAGLTHDLAHLGLSNPSQKKVFAEDRPRITGILDAVENKGCGIVDNLSETQLNAIARLLNMEPDKEKTPQRLVEYSNLVLNIFLPKHFNAINRKNYEYAVDPNFVKQLFFLPDQNDNEMIVNLKQMVCRSAEHMQQIASMVLYDMAVEIDNNVFDNQAPGIISRSIIGTIMNLPKDVHLLIANPNEKMVHFVDVLNTFPENKALSEQALRGLMIEFVTEYRDFGGCEAVIPTWKNDEGIHVRNIDQKEFEKQLKEIDDAHKAQNVQEEFGKIDGDRNIFKKFINGQKFFVNGIALPDIATVFNPDNNNALRKEPFAFLTQRGNEFDRNPQRVKVLSEVYREIGFIGNEKIGLVFI
jgi:hypothetical protein